MSKRIKEELKLRIEGLESQSPLVSPRIIASGNSTASVEMDLNILFKFVNSYDGSRETLNSFIVNCDNVYELASDPQKPILFKYIISQLRGKAEIACSIKEFQNWEQLKEFLKTQFCERKHYSHLLTELQESKQSPQESVSQFALKIEACLSQLLTEVSLSTSKVKELPGRTAAMEDLALHHFTVGLLPRISSIVRCKSPKNLNEAINVAISEERIQQSVYKRSQPTENKFSKPNKPTYSQFRNNQYQGQSRINQNQGQFRNNQIQNQNSNDSNVCRYCKFPGHSIENCRKREYNNNRARNFEQPSTSGYKPQHRVHFVEKPDDNVEPNFSDDDDEAKND